MFQYSSVPTLFCSGIPVFWLTFHVPLCPISVPYSSVFQWSMLLCSSMQEFQHTSVLLSPCSNVPHSNVYCSLFGALAAPVFWSLVFWCSKTPQFHYSNVPCSLFRCWGVLCSSAPIFCVLLFQCSTLPFSSALVFWCFFCSVQVFQHSKALWCSGVPSIPFTLFGIFLFQCFSVPVFRSSVFHSSGVPAVFQRPKFRVLVFNFSGVFWCSSVYNRS